MKKVKKKGCGYCYKEKQCKKRDPKVNKAEKGCKDYKHFEDKQ